MDLDGPFLAAGVNWTAGGPALSLHTEGRTARQELRPNAELRFQVVTPPDRRHCLGYSTVHGPASRQQTLCPEGNDAVRGFHCEQCFRRDDFRYLHDIHRSGIAPPGLQAYVDQEHWLYVATFADGTSKVGTASSRSKFSRLAEQGAVAAEYVAWAADGRIIRRLEDAVTEAAGLPQAVRSATKLAGLANPLPAADVANINAAKAEQARKVVDGGALLGCRPIQERWLRPELASVVCEGQGRLLYPHELAGGEHGLILEAAHGSFAACRIDDLEAVFLVDLSQLKGKRLLLGAYRSAQPVLQEALF